VRKRLEARFGGADELEKLLFFKLCTSKPQGGLAFSSLPLGFAF